MNNRLWLIVSICMSSLVMASDRPVSVPPVAESAQAEQQQSTGENVLIKVVQPTENKATEKTEEGTIFKFTEAELNESPVLKGLWEDIQEASDKTIYLPNEITAKNFEIIEPLWRLSAEITVAQGEEKSKSINKLTENIFELMKSLPPIKPLIDLSHYFELKQIYQKIIKKYAQNLLLKGNLLTFMDNPALFDKTHLNFVSDIQRDIANFLAIPIVGIANIDQNNNGHISSVKALVLSNDGNTLISGSYDETIKIFDVSNSFLPISSPPIFHASIDMIRPVGALALSTDSNTLVAGVLGVGAKIFNTKQKNSPELRATIDQVKVSAISLSSDGNTVALGSDDSTIKIFNITKTEPQSQATIDETHFNGHSGRIISLVMSRDGNTIISSSSDKTIKIFDISNKTSPVLLGAIPVDQERMLAGNVLALSEDNNTFAFGTSYGIIKIFDITNKRSPQLLATIGKQQGGHSNSVTGLAFNSAGTLLISGSLDETSKIFDISNKSKPVLRATINYLQGLAMPVSSVALNGDATLLALGTDYGEINLFMAPRLEIKEWLLVYYALKNGKQSPLFYQTPKLQPLYDGLIQKVPAIPNIITQ